MLRIVTLVYRESPKLFDIAGKSPINSELVLREMYGKLARTWGPQHWWPADSAFEVIVGAILTQNTSWTNVERALNSLRSAGALSIEAVRSLPLPNLQELVRSSGYYRQKAQRLKGLVAFLDEKYGGSLEKMFAVPTGPLRTELLSLNGIGYETADAILLYAGNHEIFVVDAYTRRIMTRHALVKTKASYDEVRTLVECALQHEQPENSSIPAAGWAQQIQIHDPSAMSRSHRNPQTQIYNEMHGLMVQVGKHYCLKQEPKCQECPLRDYLPADGPSLKSQ